jgi:hypothetical protein
MAYNISARGIGVALTYPVQPGTNLLIELLGWNQGQGVRARVVRSILDGFVWFHGCEFINPLNKEQLQGWLT